MTTTANLLNGTHYSNVAGSIGYDASQAIVGAPTGVVTTINSVASQTVIGNAVTAANLGYAQTAKVIAGGSFAGLSSQTAAGSGLLGTSATLLSGTAAGNAGAYQTLSETWRARTNG